MKKFVVVNKSLCDSTHPYLINVGVLRTFLGRPFFVLVSELTLCALKNKGTNDDISLWIKYRNAAVVRFQIGRQKRAIKKKMFSIVLFPNSLHKSVSVEVTILTGLFVSSILQVFVFLSQLIALKDNSYIFHLSNKTDFMKFCPTILFFLILSPSSAFVGRCE